ncbi:polysaccharide pyruvyl transferase family protein [Serinibacter salmoneus]|uniref:polysaccharide pyruvyl transferase family protein n=1 Tax=Serinibacter salmoneus TaxID=556530 RepID=UPI00117A28C4|nr:polysaccharide pyruvyl transferase family protein [Serinibacter salmoneus]
MVLVSPSGRGNIGDQAMFEAILANTDGAIDIVLHSSNSLRVPVSDLHRVRLHVLPRLVRGGLIRRIPDVRSFAALAGSASEVMVPGADTIDGGHAHASLARLSLVVLAHDAGAAARVQGFSWSDHVPASVTTLMRSVAKRALVFPRDPRAVERLQASHVAPITPAADVVFSYRREADLSADLQSWLDSQKEAGRRVVALNVSGFIARNKDLLDEYVTVVSHLRSRDVSVLFVPHVLRAGDSDLVAIRHVVERVGLGEDFLIENQLSPAQVQTVARGCACVITGRMHFAIMSLSNAVPAVTLATVGKVEGLYDMFSLPELVVQPAPGMAESIVNALESVLADRTSFASTISSSLGRVQELSARNFDAGGSH